MSQTLIVWIGFNLFVMGMLALDLGVFNRKSHVVSVKEASAWVVVWITMAIAFGIGVYFWQGTAKSLEFFTGYIIEYSLSADNIFVFVLIFSFFSVPAQYQHRILFWGILGALLMRGTMIFLGAALIERFGWLIYLFGAFLIFTGIRMAFHKDEEIHPEHNPVIKLVRRILPITKEYAGNHFFVRHAGKLMATPLFVVLITVETTDLIFAIDSIPAIFGVTTDVFIVYTSNVFAILGLRSLYFILRGAVDQFHYLKVGLSAILVFVGIKMVLGYWYHVPIGISLLMILSLLTLAIVASLIRTGWLSRREGTPRQKTAHTDTVERRGAVD